MFYTFYMLIHLLTLKCVRLFSLSSMSAAEGPTFLPQNIQNIKRVSDKGSEWAKLDSRHRRRFLLASLFTRDEETF